MLFTSCSWEGCNFFYLESPAVINIWVADSKILLIFQILFEKKHWSEFQNVRTVEKNKCSKYNWKTNSWFEMFPIKKRNRNVQIIMWLCENNLNFLIFAFARFKIYIIINLKWVLTHNQISQCIVPTYLRNIL